MLPFEALLVAWQVVPAALALDSGQLSPEPARVAGIVAKMEAAYARVQGYRAETDVRTYRDGRLIRERRFLYTFQKPDHVRLDFETPHAGMVVIYPDDHGRVEVKPGGWLGFLKMHYSPDSPRLRSSSGQRIDQTDVGLLIHNIAHSVSDQRRGELAIDERNGQALIRVLAQDHFLPGVETLYRFTIDERLWLPVAVEELTPGGALKRDIAFNDLRTTSPTQAGPARENEGG